MSATLMSPEATTAPRPVPVRRLPAVTVRERPARKTLTHGMRLGWRVSDGREYPVIVRRLGGE